METTKKRPYIRGYSLIINSAIAWWISAGLTTSGLNVWVPAYVAKFGWDNSSLLMWSTVGGILSVIGSFVFSSIVMKKGTRWVSAITYILAGIVAICMGFVTNMAGYAIFVILGQILSVGYSGTTTNTLIGNWFPKSKAVILGITTMGMPLAACLFVPLLSALISNFGLTNAFVIIGVITILIGIACIFWIRDYPSECGFYPENKPELAKQEATLSEFKSQWTLGKLLCNKNAWFIAIAYGLLFLVTQGMVSQTVSYLVEFGLEQAKAVSTLSMCSLIGIGGSFIWGILDQKLGTKAASLIYAGWYIVVFCLLRLQPSYAVVMVGCVMLGFAIGGIGNLQPSMIMTAFGVKEFASVNRVVWTIATLIRAFAFLAMSIGLKLFGSYQGATVIFLGCAVVAFILICFINKKDCAE